MLAFATVIVLHLFIIFSPGPNMLLVWQTALSHSRRAAFYTVLGIASGTAVWALAASFGIGWVLEQAAWFAPALRLVGGAFLIYLGVRAWQTANIFNGPAPVSPAASQWAQYRLGLLTVLTNPKSLIFFTSVFAAQLSLGVPVWLKLLAVAVVVFNASWWYSALAVLFSHRAVQNFYQRRKIFIERLTGSVFAVLGGWLIVEAL